MPEELKPKELPDCMIYLWQTFISISGCRQHGMSGPLAISYSEMKSWSELTGNELSPLDIEILRRLDSLYIKVMNG